MEDDNRWRKDAASHKKRRGRVTRYGRGGGIERDGGWLESIKKKMGQTDRQAGRQADKQTGQLARNWI